MISGNMVGSYSQMGKTFVLVDEDGNEITGVVVDQETVFTAGDNDVREGMVYASDDGVSIGTKKIPVYHTWQGTKVIPSGSQLSINNIDPKIDYHDYTELQSMICSFNTSLSNSVSTEKVTIKNSVYEVLSTTAISTIVKNYDSKTIEFGVVNTSDKPCIIRFFMYKEIY